MLNALRAPWAAPHCGRLSTELEAAHQAPPLYVEMPGRYDGDVPYHRGDRARANFIK